MSQMHIVLVEDDESLLQLLKRLLTEEGYHVTAVSEGTDAIEAIREKPTHIIITDLKLSGVDGFEVLERARQIDSHIVGIVITGYSSVDHAVRAMKAGAFDFITKPFDVDAVSLVVKKAIEFQRLRQENVLLKRTVREQYRLDHLIGTSARMRAVLEFIEKVADSDSTVLIQGESGTGKELAARMLHYNSFRRDRPLVPVNCGAIPENLLESELFGHEKGAFTGALNGRLGRFELAHGGTIFLDEVAEMSLSLQVKLLRVLQERSFERVGGTKTIGVDVRIIAATNQDLEEAVQDRRFRKDLYYRLNVIPVTMPALRDRHGDIPLLVDHFVERFNRTKKTSVEGMEPAALNHLMQHAWPGNIRELENLIERLVVLKKTGCLSVADLPERMVQTQVTSVSYNEPIDFNGAGVDLVREMDRYESRLIMEALRQAKGITSKAAQMLHLNRTTLVEKMKRKGLDAKHQGDLHSSC